MKFKKVNKKRNAFQEDAEKYSRINRFTPTSGGVRC